MRALVAAILATLASPLAHADPTTQDAALVHLQRGVDAFGARDFVRARHELAEAQSLAPEKPNPYRWLALTDIQLGDCAQALVDIDGFLSRVGAEDKRRDELLRLRELCSHTGSLQVSATPPQVTLRIDGAIVGTTPFATRSLRAGSHDLVGEKPGFIAASRRIELQAGTALDVHLSLSKHHDSITKKWWFWTALGAAAAAGGAAYVIATRSDTTTLPPVHCDATGCHP